MSLDFTPAKYDLLCRRAVAAGFDFLPVRGYLRAGHTGSRSLVLRHDVDRTPRAALRLAELEEALGLSATYYVRSRRRTFLPELLRELTAMGHEVGYHYETLVKARGDKEAALAIFERELAGFREIVPVDTVSMHGSPLSPWNNAAIWRGRDPADFGLLGDAGLHLPQGELYYFSDTGRSWDTGTNNIRDRVPSRPHSRPIVTTDELIEFLTGECDADVVLNTHPNRWNRDPLRWCVSWASDRAANRLKRAFRAGGNCAEQAPEDG